jgi:hypothetical protein
MRYRGGCCSAFIIALGRVTKAGMVCKFGAQYRHRCWSFNANANAMTGDAADRNDDVLVDEYLLADPTC